MNKPKTISIAILDDHQIVIDGLILLLESVDDIEISFTANSVQEFKDKLKLKKTDIAILDIQLPQDSGLSLCKTISKKYPDIRSIILTMIDQPSMIKKMYLAGAKGYLLKNLSKNKLLTSIYKVYNNELAFDEDQLKIIEDLSRIQNSSYNTIPRLSMREKEILALIIKEYTTPDMAKELFISTGTVITHRRNIISKLGVKNTAGVVRRALELGLI